MFTKHEHSYDDDVHQHGVDRVEFVCMVTKTTADNLQECLGTRGTDLQLN